MVCPPGVFAIFRAPIPSQIESKTLRQVASLEGAPSAAESSRALRRLLTRGFMKANTCLATCGFCDGICRTAERHGPRKPFSGDFSTLKLSGHCLSTLSTIDQIAGWFEPSLSLLNAPRTSLTTFGFCARYEGTRRAIPRIRPYNDRRTRTRFDDHRALILLPRRSPSSSCVSIELFALSKDTVFFPVFSTLSWSSAPFFDLFISSSFFFLFFLSSFFLVSSSRSSSSSSSSLASLASSPSPSSPSSPSSSLSSRRKASRAARDEERTRS
mmetsp:Transcript_13172/g.32301  ORF Transcript_13172/g.32301 Transcript_13172/m.32301 type:complete len:270 (+) Transcript_13172:173-982(+)